MKTLDLFSKRILIIAASISLVLLSLSAFLLTIQRVTAASPPQEPQIVGIGVDNTHIYYAIGKPGDYILRKEIKSTMSSGDALK